MKRKTYKTAIYVIASVLLMNNTMKAQEASTDTLTGSVAKTQTEVDLLKRVKISGYVQSQFQWGDSLGMKSFAGGDFPSNTDKRFKVRRAEFKTMYDNGMA